jgi:hypothetical protein
MNKYKLGEFKITVPSDMLVSFTTDNKIMVVTNKKENEIHCIIELNNNKLLFNNGWNIKYLFDINENEIELQYNFIENE